MIDFFKSVKTVLKLDSVCIDNTIFRLHYKLTVSTLMAFSLIVTSKQYIGDPISCLLADDSKMSIKFVETYCWINSTFTTIKRPTTKPSIIGVDSIAKGVDANYKEGDPIDYQRYYQWVCFVLFFQAMLFYIPRFMWKMWEGGRIEQLVGELNKPIITDVGSKNEQKRIIVRYFTTNTNNSNAYAFRFVFCELLNFINVVGQIYFMDYFLDGEFWSYGLHILYKTNSRADAMAKIFPKFTKCTIYTFGQSGSPQIRDSYCLLPINVANEKIYICLWFWFVILSILSAFQLLFRTTVLVFPKIRMHLLRARAHLLNGNTRSKVIKLKNQFGDWFILYQLAKNINPLVFAEILQEISKKYKTGVSNMEQVV